MTPTTTRPLVTLRGTNRGFEIVVADGVQPDELITSLEAQLLEAPQFFANSDVTLRFGHQPGSRLLEPLERVTASHGLRIVGVCVGDDEVGPLLQQRAPQRAGNVLQAPRVSVNQGTGWTNAARRGVRRQPPQPPQSFVDSFMPPPPRGQRTAAAATPTAMAAAMEGARPSEERRDPHCNEVAKPTTLPRPPGLGARLGSSFAQRSANGPGVAPSFQPPRSSATDPVALPKPEGATSRTSRLLRHLGGKRRGAEPKLADTPDARIAETQPSPARSEQSERSSEGNHSDDAEVTAVRMSPLLLARPTAPAAAAAVTSGPNNGPHNGLPSAIGQPSASTSITSWADTRGSLQAPALPAGGAPQDARIDGLRSEFAEAPVMVRGPVRSGMKLESEGHLIVVGDVNPGAELRAAGNVIILGTLRGIAHAGCASEKGFVWAIRLDAQQIRIGTLVARAGDTDPQTRGAEIAFAADGRIIVENYNGRLPPGVDTALF